MENDSSLQNFFQKFTQFVLENEPLLEKKFKENDLTIGKIQTDVSIKIDLEKHEFVWIPEIKEKNFTFSEQQKEIKIIGKNATNDDEFQLTDKQTENYLSLSIGKSVTIKEYLNSNSEIEYMARIKISTEIINESSTYFLAQIPLEINILPNNVLQIFLRFNNIERTFVITKEITGIQVESYIKNRETRIFTKDGSLLVNQIHIGRHQSSTICISHPYVSGWHATIAYENKWIIKDELSSNGLWKLFHNKHSNDQIGFSSPIILYNKTIIKFLRVRFEITIKHMSQNSKQYSIKPK